MVTGSLKAYLGIRNTWTNLGSPTSQFSLTGEPSTGHCIPKSVSRQLSHTVVGCAACSSQLEEATGPGEECGREATRKKKPVITALQESITWSSLTQEPPGLGQTSDACGGLAHGCSAGSLGLPRGL